MTSRSRREFLAAAALPLLAALPVAAVGQSSPRCSICGQAISGRYKQYTLRNGAGHTVCRACESAAPRCTGCKVPYATRQLEPAGADGSLWCRECLARTPRCSLCKSPVSGTYFQIEHQPGLWCAACWHGKEHCGLCQAPMLAPARVYPDGRRLCAGCEQTSVHGAQAHWELASRAAGEIESFLGAPLAIPPIQVVNLDQLNVAVADMGRHREGAAATAIHELGMFRVRGRAQEILVLDGLPEDLAMETMAHELAHAWLHQHVPGERQPVLEEGFAQWVAEAVCHRTYHRSGLKRIRQRPDLYGDGFRLVEALEIRGGRGLVLEAMRTNTIPGSAGSQGGTSR